MILTAWRQKTPADAEAARRRRVLPMVARRMRRFGHPGWHVHGDLVKGPGSLAIKLRDNHTDSPAHLDLDFVLDVSRPDGSTVSDCIQGFARTTRRAQRKAVDVWATVTAATVIELLSPTGTHARHIDDGEANGLPGWRAIHGATVLLGGQQAAPLQQWLADHPVLPSLAPALAGELDRQTVNGIKIAFGCRAGEEVCEVRINGRISTAATAALSELPWPRLPVKALCRTFILLAPRHQ